MASLSSWTATATSKLVNSFLRKGVQHHDWHLNSWDYKITLSQDLGALRQVDVLRRDCWSS